MILISWDHYLEFHSFVWYVDLFSPFPASFTFSIIFFDYSMTTYFEDDRKFYISYFHFKWKQEVLTIISEGKFQPINVSKVSKPTPIFVSTYTCVSIDNVIRSRKHLRICISRFCDLKLNGKIELRNCNQPDFEALYPYNS